MRCGRAWGWRRRRGGRRPRGTPTQTTTLRQTGRNAVAVPPWLVRSARAINEPTQSALASLTLKRLHCRHVHPGRRQHRAPPCPEPAPLPRQARPSQPRHSHRPCRPVPIALCNQVTPHRPRPRHASLSVQRTRRIGWRPVVTPVCHPGCPQHLHPLPHCTRPRPRPRVRRRPHLHPHHSCPVPPHTQRHLPPRLAPRAPAGWWGHTQGPSHSLPRTPAAPDLDGRGRAVARGRRRRRGHDLCGEDVEQDGEGRGGGAVGGALSAWGAAPRDCALDSAGVADEGGEVRGGSQGEGRTARVRGEGVEREGSGAGAGGGCVGGGWGG